MSLLKSNQMEDMANYVIAAKYARFDHKKKRRETWDEIVDRVRDMHLFRYGSKGIDNDINKAFEMVRQKKVLPSMRSLQYGGGAILANDARMYNCSYTLADRKEFFREFLWMLLSGVGVGFSVQKQHIEKLPRLTKNLDQTDRQIMTYAVEDTIEGWSDALHILVSSFFKGSAIAGREVFFDFTRIRRKGSWLKVSGGRAPGPKPLQQALKNIKKILRDAVEGDQDKLTPIQVYDMSMIASDCVLSGGLRRSATLAIFSHDDEEMAKAKTFSQIGKIISGPNKDGVWQTEFGPATELKKYDKNFKELDDPVVAGDEVTISWINLHPWRARSNNSAALLRGSVKRADFNKLFESTRKFGEPGFIFLDDLDHGFNPCLTGDTRLLTENGYVELKKLWETNGKHEYGRTKDAAEYGTMNIVNSKGVVSATNVYKTSQSSPVYRIELKNGQAITATPNHKFFRINEAGVERVRLDELKIDDKLPLGDSSSFGGYDNVDYALLAGWVTGDGSISKNSQGLQRAHVVVYECDFDDCLPILRESLLKLYKAENRSTNQDPSYSGCEQNPKNFNFKKKTMESVVLGRMMSEDGCHHGTSFGVESTKHKVPERIWQGDRETICAYLTGIFSADGTVNISGHKKSCSVRLWQANKEYLQEIQALLLQLNITSSINLRLEARKVLMNDGKGGEKLYNNKDQYEIYIGSIENLTKFTNNIGFMQSAKNKKVRDWLNTRSGSSNNSHTKYHSKINSIEFVGNEETFCLTEFEDNEIIADGIVVGNCCEIGLNPIDSKTGKTGVQFCNLTEINGGAIKTEEDFKNAVWAATLIGTLQAGYSYLSYLTDTTRSILRKERLLGVSVTGWMDNPDLLLNPKIQKKMAMYAVEVNKEFSKHINIRPAARVTTTKPAGTTSIVLGTGSGIHPQHSRKYFRRIQANSIEQPLQFYKLNNPHAIEKSVWGKNDEVITFCIDIPETAKVLDDYSAVEFLKIVKSTYENWIIPGTADPDSSKGLHHNVSNTVSVADDEWEEVADFIWKNRTCFSGISMLSKLGDKIYRQAPRESIRTKEDKERWNMLVKSHNNVNWKMFSESEDYTTANMEVACAGGKCDL